MSRNLVQPIAVLPADHFTTIAAVALASAQSLGNALAGSDVPGEAWQSWLNASFTKSVRRVRSESVLTRLETLGLPLTRYELVDGPQRAVALAYGPMVYEDYPKPLKSLQVSGLDRPRWFEDFWLDGKLKPTIELNAQVKMSTGKAAAQTAHALCAWLLSQSPQDRADWLAYPGLTVDENEGFIEYEHEPEDPGVIMIRDSGLTEVAPGTATARVRITSR